VGHPELPVMGILFQAPQWGKITIQVMEHVFESVADCLVYPVPRLTSTQGGKRRTIFAKDDSVYHSSAFYPEKPVEIGSRDILRGTTVSRLKL